MVTLTLRRFLTAKGATLGQLTGLSRTLYVLEDEWRGNQRGISCIPTGTYQVKPHGWESGSPFKFKQTWQLQNVPGRTGILIHAGNTHRDTEGCLLLGMGLLLSQEAASVTESRTAIDLLRKEIGQQAFSITVQ